MPEMWAPGRRLLVFYIRLHISGGTTVCPSPSFPFGRCLRPAPARPRLGRPFWPPRLQVLEKHSNSSRGTAPRTCTHACAHVGITLRNSDPKTKTRKERRCVVRGGLFPVCTVMHLTRRYLFVSRVQDTHTHEAIPLLRHNSIHNTKRHRTNNTRQQQVRLHLE